MNTELRVPTSIKCPAFVNVQHLRALLMEAVGTFVFVFSIALIVTNYESTLPPAFGIGFTLLVRPLRLNSHTFELAFFFFFSFFFSFFFLFADLVFSFAFSVSRLHRRSHQWRALQSRAHAVGACVRTSQPTADAGLLGGAVRRRAAGRCAGARHSRR
jgi:hypothetical protein